MKRDDPSQRGSLAVAPVPGGIALSYTVALRE